MPAPSKPLLVPPGPVTKISSITSLKVNPLTGLLMVLQPRLPLPPSIKRSIFTIPLTVVPVISPIRAVPLASDLSVKKPAEANVAVPVTLTVPDEAPPFMFNALPKVVVPLPDKVRLFSKLLEPKVLWSKLSVFELEPPMVRLDEDEPLKNPKPEMVPFTVNVLLPMATISLAVLKSIFSATVIDEVSVLVLSPLKINFL